jgi:hypothetical protein
MGKGKREVKLAFRSAPTTMSSHSELDKQGVLTIESKKEYANSKDTHIDRVRIPKSVLDKARKLKNGDIAGFKELCYDFCYQLKVTSKFVRTNECKHPRELSHCLRHITAAIERPDLCKQSGDYGKAGKEKMSGTKAKAVKTGKLVKAKVKAAKAGKEKKVAVVAK